MARTKDSSDEVMTFGEHLEALRWHLIRAVIGVAVCFGLCLWNGNRLLRFLLAPLREALERRQAGEIVATDMMDGLWAFFQISMVGGLLLASPWVVYQLWGFVALGLYAQERRFVYRSVPCFAALFCAGAVFGWCVALPSSVEFMVRFNQSTGLHHQITAPNWATFALAFPLAFGLAAELPLVMVVLTKLGLVGASGFRRGRRIAILVTAVVSAVLTPSPSPVDMMFMWLPLVLIYEVGLVCVRLVERRGARVAESEEHGSTDLLAAVLIPLAIGPSRGGSGR